MIQLQATAESEEESNVIFWTSGRLAKLYDSVFIAELKAARNSLVEFLQLKNDIIRAFPNVKPVMFCDNQSMVDKVNSDGEVHPFATDYADFVRQAIKEHNICVKWCASAAN